MTNDECMGYVIQAMKNLDEQPERIQRILKELDYLFDIMSESEAQAVFNKDFSKYWHHKG